MGRPSNRRTSVLNRMREPLSLRSQTVETTVLQRLNDKTGKWGNVDFLFPVLLFERFLGHWLGGNEPGVMFLRWFTIADRSAIAKSTPQDPSV